MFTYSDLENLHMLLGTLDTCDQFRVPPQLTQDNIRILLKMQRKVEEEMAYWQP